jgi:hypothetical protein
MGSSSVGTLQPRYAIQIGALIQINRWQTEVDPTATRISAKGSRHAARAPKPTREPKEPVAVPPPQEAPSPLPTVSDELIAIEFNDFCLCSWRAAISSRLIAFGSA